MSSTLRRKEKSYILFRLALFLPVYILSLTTISIHPEKLIISLIHNSIIPTYVVNSHLLAGCQVDNYGTKNNVDPAS